MQKILKRLELIKTAISIEDEEIIELQLLKLDATQYDNEVSDILEKISKKDYSSVIQDIEDYLNKFSGVAVYEDKELAGLRLELKALEKILQDLSSQKNEYLNDIHEFNVQYHLKLGNVIQKILNLKEELLHEKVQKKKRAFEKIKDEYASLKAEYQNLKLNKEAKEQELEEMDEFDDDYEEHYEELQRLKSELNQKEQELNEKRKQVKQAKEDYEEDEVTKEYEEVKQDSNEFNKEYEEVKQEDRLEITEDEKKELKNLFRKASKLCHPDIVPDELKEQAHEMMQKLNEAYSKRDVQAVKEMLTILESGKGFDVASDTINDKDLLKSKIVDVRDMIDQNEIDLADIKGDEVVQIMSEYDDVEDYFSALKEELESEYDRLRGIETPIIVSKKEKIEEKVESSDEINTDDEEYWSGEF